MVIISRIADKVGALGTVVSGMGCAMCFPALASLGSAMGLGFLAHWEPVFVTTLLPLFAGIALIANAVYWRQHRRWHRLALGVLGPLVVLAGLYTLGRFGESRYIFYGGLSLMLVTAVWDLIAPPRRLCTAVGGKAVGSPQRIAGGGK